MIIGKYKIEANQHCFTLKEPKVSKDGKSYDHTIGFYTSFEALARRVATEDLKSNIDHAKNFEELIASTAVNLRKLFSYARINDRNQRPDPSCIEKSAD